MINYPFYALHQMGSASLPMIGDFRGEDPKIQELAIILAQDHPDAEPEPDPQLDYRWLHSLISICRSVMDNRDIKCADYVAQARQQYYYCHQKFHYHHRELQDCLAYSCLLDKQKEKLLASSDPPDEAKLKEIYRQHALNDRDMLPLKKKVEECSKNRREATAWFSKAKADFIRTEMPRLVYCAKHLYANHAAKEGAVHPRVEFLRRGPLTFSSGTYASPSSGADSADNVNGVAGALGADGVNHVDGSAGAPDREFSGTEPRH
ncbi:MAG: hypothetical protein Q9167_005987 [Letrouitia subvulpina]